MDAGETWHGALTLGTSRASTGDIGVIPVTIHRVADDVTKTADKTQAAPGDVITYTVDVAPNVTREDLAYTITDTLPEGSTYVEGSATNGASYDDGVVSWTGDLESTFGDEGNYTITTSASRPELPDAVRRRLPRPPPLTWADHARAGHRRRHHHVLGVRRGHVRVLRQSYQGLTFSDDGFLVYGDDNYDPAGKPWVAQSRARRRLPNNVAALMWQDMEFRYDAATGAGVTLADRGSRTRATSPSSSTTTCATSATTPASSVSSTWRSSRLLAATTWCSPTTTSAAATCSEATSYDDVTIGTENAPASQAAALVNQGDANGVLEDGLNVCATYSEPAAEGASFTYQVKVNDTVGNKDLTNTVVHTPTTRAPSPCRRSTPWRSRVRPSAPTWRCRSTRTAS